MRVDLVPISEMNESYVARWHELQDADPSYDNAFLSPEFARAVDRARPGVEVAVFEDGAAGFLPFERTGRNVSALGLGLADAQGAVMANGAEVPWRDFLLAAKAGLIDFDHLIGPQATKELHSWSVTSPIVDLPDGVSAYEAERLVSHKERFKGFERKAKRMARELGEVTFTYDAFSEEAFAKLIEWKSAHYRRSGYVNIYKDDWYVSFLRDLATTKSEHCSGIFSTLHVGGRLAAVQISVKSRNTLSGWVPTYDTELGRHSPGIELLRHILRAHDGSFTRYDFGRGDEAYKQQFKTGDLTVSNAWVGRPTFSAYGHRLRVAPREKAERFILAHPALRAKVRSSLKKVAELKASGGGPGGSSGKDHN